MPATSICRYGPEHGAPGQGPPAGCDYYGLLISRYSATQIAFTLGSEYPTYGSLKGGDPFTLHVLGVAFAGKVAAAPTITGFSPHSGPVGSTVTIKGRALARVTEVTFNGAEAAVASDKTTIVKVKVPKGATTGRIQVTTAAGSIKSATDFTVT